MHVTVKLFGATYYSYSNGKNELIFLDIEDFNFLSKVELLDYSLIWKQKSIE